MSPGDMLGTGTISAPTEDGLGALVEMNQAGKKVAFTMADGEERKFFKDGDEVNITASCQGNGFIIGFGDCLGKILPAHDDSMYFG
jgi:fumarylacetoacetase